MGEYVSHRHRRLLHIATAASWILAAAVMSARAGGPLQISETLMLMVVIVATLSSVIAAALAPVVSQNRLLATMVREQCGRCPHSGQSGHPDVLPGDRVVIPMRTIRDVRGTQRVDRV